MSRSVLLVEPDLDALGTLASKLRARGLTVALADRSEGILDRVRNMRPDAILLSEALPDNSTLVSQLAEEAQLAPIECFTLIAGGPTTSAAPDQLCRDDVEGIVKRLYALPSRPPSVPAGRDDFRGDLGQVSLPDLLQLLSMNRRTGSLSVTVPSGAGQVRLIDGQLVDAVFRRVEREKALFRLLGEGDGSFVFTSGLPAPVCRIATPTNVLLMEGMRVVDEVRRRRTALAAEEDALVATSEARDEYTDVQWRVMEALSSPHTVDELLDEVPEADHELLEALDTLLDGGQVRRIPKGAVRVELGAPEQMTVLGAMANRLRARGYCGPARVVVAATARRLIAVTHAVRRIADAVIPADPPPSVALPHLLATMRLGDGAELDIVGLPTEAEYSPTWGLSLGGTAVVVRLGATECRVLDDACETAGVSLFAAEALLGDVNEEDPTQMAALICAALDAVAGG